MIIEQHYDEEVLAEFLAEPADAVTRDKHLSSCGLCLTTLDSLRASADILAEPAVWDRTPISTSPRPDTLAFLRNVQQTMKDEDATAAVWVKQLLAGPRETWAPRLEQHPEWRTGGMVRALMRAGDGVIDVVPADALEITRLAVEIVGGLPNSKQTRHLAALAMYDHAYALWHTGSILQALDNLTRARTLIATDPTAEFDLARVDSVRAMIFQNLERREEAIAIARSVTTIFDRYGDADRSAAARSAEAITLQTSQRLREAIQIHQRIVETSGVTDRWRVPAYQNMGMCYVELGEFTRATDCLREAISGYERLGMFTLRSRVRGSLAEIFARQGRHAQALPIFEELRAEFEDLSMATDVAFVCLDIAESLIALDRAPEVSEVCRTAIAYFVANGLSHTEPAMRGIAYLREAAASGRPLSEAIHGVRAFMKAPTEAGHLLFLQPPQ